MVGYLNAHGELPHLYSQFESMWFNPDNNDDIETFEVGEPSYIVSDPEWFEDEIGFGADSLDGDYPCECDGEEPLQTPAEIAKWVAERYWYILEEIEAADRIEPQATQAAPQSTLTLCFTCGGRRSTKLELDPKEHEDRMYGRWVNRDKHNQGRGRMMEIVWKRRAGGGRRGRATLRTMVN